MLSSDINNTRMTQSTTPGPGSKWLKRIGQLLCASAFVFAGIAIYLLWVDRDTNNKFLMQTTREIGAESKASRCVGECVQIGDTYTAMTFGGSIANTTSIYIYAQDRLLVSCVSCQVLSIVIKTLGKLDIVGISLPHKCQANKTNLDALEASVAVCGGGDIEHVTFEVR